LILLNRHCLLSVEVIEQMKLITMGSTLPLSSITKLR